MVPVWLIGLFYLWQTVTEKFLSLIECDTFTMELLDEEGNVRGTTVETRWMTDPDLKCYEGDHLIQLIIAGIGISVWTVGFVVVSMAILYRNREILYEQATLRKYGFLYLGYERKVWYWETAKRVQAFFYGVISNYPLGDIRAKLVLYALLAGISCIMHVMVNPYDERQNGILDYLETYSLIAVFVSQVLLQVSFLVDR